MLKFLQKLIAKWNNLSKKRKFFCTLAFSCLLILVLLPLLVQADVVFNVVSEIISAIFGVLIFVAGWFATKLLEILLYVAQWNSFLNIEAVIIGWKLVRDLCNMFFIIILLVIAVGTILKIESYSYKKWLAKLVIVAIVINFSKYITGVLITLSQVAMLAFVGSFKEAAVGNIVKGLHLDAFLSAVRGGDVDVDVDKAGKMTIWNVIAVYSLATLFLIILCMVLLIMIVILVGRMVSLWVLTILSPFAYFFQASPIGTEYSKKWWQLFGKNLVAGPVLAFFLWLTFYTIQMSGQSISVSMKGPVIGTGETIPTAESSLAGISNTNYMIDFIVVIGLLIAAIKITQEMGVIGSKFAGQMQQGLGKFARSVAKGAGKVAALPAVGAWEGVKGLGKYGVRKLNEGIADGKVNPILNPKALWRGYQARRKKLHEDAKEGADAAAEDTVQKFFTGSHQGRRVAFQHSKEDEYVKQFSNKPKEVIAREVAKLDANSHKSSEDKARLRGLIKLAFTKGYDDDILGHSHFDKYRKNKNGEYDSDIRGNKQSLRAFQHMLGNDAAGLEILALGDEISHKTGHSNIAGLTNYDLEKDELRVSDWDEEKEEFTFDRNIFLRAEEKEKNEAIEVGKNTAEQLARFQAQTFVGLKQIVVNGEVETVGTTMGKTERNNVAGVSVGTDQPRQWGRSMMARTINALLGGHYSSELPETKDNGKTMTVLGGAQNIRALQNIGFISTVEKGTLRAALSRAGSKDFEKDEEMEKEMKFEVDGTSIGLDEIKKHSEGCEWDNWTEPEIDEYWNKFFRDKGFGDAPARYEAPPSSRPEGVELDEDAESESEEELRPSAPRMAEDFDEEKHERTPEMIKRYKDAGEDFYESAEYLDNQDEYESGVDYRRHENALNQKELDKIRGVATASTRKQGAEQAGVGLNFNDSDIQKALGVTTNQDAVYFGGENKQKAINVIIKIYKKQLQDSGDDEYKAKAERLRGGLQNSETLRVHNNTSMSSRTDQARHERAHARTQNLSDDDFNEIWNSMEKPQQKVIGYDLKARYPNLTDQQMKQEAVAEMVGVGKGIYEPQYKTRKVLADKNIKTRRDEEEDEIVKKVGEASAMIRAGGSKAKTGLKNFAKLLGKMGSSLWGGVEKIADLPISKIESKIEKVKRDINSAIKGLNDKKIGDAGSKLDESYTKKKTLKENYNKVKQTNESAIEEVENKKRKNVDDAKEHFELAKKAQKDGHIAEARNETRKGNEFLDNNNIIDRDTINPLKDEIKKAKEDYAKAVSQVVKDYENFNKLVGNASPEAKRALEKVVKIVSPVEKIPGEGTEDKETKKTKIKKATQGVKPEEIVKAGQEEVEEKTKEINSDKLGSKAIVGALASIENVLIAVQSSLEKMPSAKVDQGESLKLNNFIKDIKKAQSATKGTEDTDGGALDPMSIKGLLTKINSNLQKLNKDSGKSLGRMPKEVSSTNTNNIKK